MTNTNIGFTPSFRPFPPPSPALRELEHPVERYYLEDLLLPQTMETKTISMETTLSQNPFSLHLPPELWAQIFVESLPNQRYIRPDSANAPMALCQVCSAWRSIAFSIPQLWSSISVTVSTNCDVGKMKDGVQAWLGRSGALPLSLALGGVQTRSAESPRLLCLDPILDEFISFIGRWEAVKLDVTGDSSRLVLGIGALRAPLLRRFEGFQQFHTWTLVRPLVSFIGASPFLTDIVWDLPFAAYGRGPPTAGLPWSQLTRFESHRGIGVEEFVDVLRCCPSLVEGSFRLVTSINDGHSPPTTSLVHHSLATLTICFGHDKLELFLKHLTLPMLHDLTVKTVLPYSLSSQSAFVQFLSRSQPPMERLTLEGVGDQSAQLIDLLLLTPYITDLSIHHRFLNLDDTFFHSLTYVEGMHQTQPCLCPKLEVLSLRAHMTSSRGVFAAMLESRYRWDSPNVVCLKGLEVRFIGDNRDRVGKDLDRLQALREKGLSIDVSWGGLSEVKK